MPTACSAITPIGRATVRTRIGEGDKQRERENACPDSVVEPVDGSFGSGEQQYSGIHVKRGDVCVGRVRLPRRASN